MSRRPRTGRKGGRRDRESRDKGQAQRARHKGQTSCIDDSIPAASTLQRAPAMNQDFLDYGEPADSNIGIAARPDQFVRRGDDVYVPLIATDNLPPSVAINGYSRTFTLAEVEGMSGSVVFDGNAGIQYSVHSSPAAHNAVPQAFNVEPPHQVVPTDQCLHDRLTANLHANNLKRGRRTEQRYNPTTPGVLGHKVYCTHWIRTGECDFTQQGCMYVHCMPDLDTLERLGFRSYPRWFREMPYAFQQVHAKSFDAKGLNVNLPRSNPGAGTFQPRAQSAAPGLGPRCASPAPSLAGSAVTAAPFYPFDIYSAGYATSTIAPSSPMYESRCTSVHNSPAMPPSMLQQPVQQSVQRLPGPARRIARAFHHQPYPTGNYAFRPSAPSPVQSSSTPFSGASTPAMAPASCNRSNGGASAAYSSEENITCVASSTESPSAPTEHQTLPTDGAADLEFNQRYHALSPVVEQGRKPGNTATSPVVKSDRTAARRPVARKALPKTNRATVYVAPALPDKADCKDENMIVDTRDTEEGELISVE